VDAIILATPHSLYAEQIKRAVAARKVAVRRLTPSREKIASTTSPFLKPRQISRQRRRGGEAVIRTVQDTKTLISGTPEQQIIVDILMSPITVKLSAQDLN